MNEKRQYYILLFLFICIFVLIGLLLDGGRVSVELIK